MMRSKNRSLDKIVMKQQTLIKKAKKEKKVTEETDKAKEMQKRKEVKERYSRNNIKVTLQKEKEQREKEQREKEQPPVYTRYQLQEDGDTSQELTVPLEDHSELTQFKDTQQFIDDNIRHNYDTLH